METRKCVICGTEFPMTPSAIAHDKKCCCRKCTQKKQSIDKLEKRRQYPLAMRACITCGKPFPMTPIAISRNQKCCCRKCRDRADSLARKERKEKEAGPLEMRKCVICGKEFPMTPVAIACNKQVCSKQCKRKKETIDRREKVNAKKKPKVCPYCHKEFLYFGRSARAVFCSKECSYEYYKKKATKHNAEMRKKNPEAFREYMRNYRGSHKDRINSLTTEWKLRKKREEAVALQENETVIPTSKYPLRQGYEDSLGIRRLSGKSCECLKCGEKFNIICKGSAIQILDRLVLHGKSPCPYCGEAPTGTIRKGGHTSSGEMELKRAYPNFTIQSYRPDWMEGMEIDLYDPIAKVGIEYHGIYGHSTKCMQDSVASRKHKHKADLCEKNGVHLIQLYETEWEQKREIVKDKLDAIFHKDMKRLFARKLKVMILGDKDSRTSAMKFLDKNHIQGRTACQWAVGLLDGLELVAVCTFKYGTAYAIGGQTGGTEKYWELNRYATKLGYSIVGGLSRCIKAFAKVHPEVHKIVSFADRRWTSRLRSAYSSSGFVEVAECEPNYQYTDLDSRHELKNKQYMRKSQIAERATREGSPESAVYSTDKTELQMSKELGYYRVYDAGKIRYEMML